MKCHNLEYRNCMMLLVAVMGLSGACSSASKNNSVNVTKQIRQLIPYSVHVRRPAVLGADPNVGPGGPDFKTEPLPNEKYDCQPYADIFKDISEIKIRECLNTVKSEVTLRYRMNRAPAPFYELEKNEHVPPCFEEVLPKIPLPREIVFQSNEEGSLGCYSSRLNIEADELFWVKVPKAKTVLDIMVPSVFEEAANEEAFRLLLLSWMIAPFYDDKNYIPSTVMPDVFCIACMGERNMSKATKAPIVLWP